MNSRIKKILDYDDELKGRKQPCEVQIAAAVQAQRSRDAGIVRRFIDDLEKEARDIIWPSIELPKLRKRLDRVAREMKISDDNT